MLRENRRGKLHVLGALICLKLGKLELLVETDWLRNSLDLLLIIFLLATR